MKLRISIVTITVLTLLVLAGIPLQAQEHEHIAKLFITQQDGVEEKIVGLAEAIPAEKYGWSPMEGVMTVAQVLTHVAGANFMFPNFVGAKPPEGFDRKALSGMTDKAAIIAKLKESFAHSEKAFAELSHEDVHKEIKLFGRESTVANMLMLMANHQHEHLGQMIAYARSNNIVPPWSK